MVGRAEAEPVDAAPGVFSRAASGLIRVGGTWDVLIYNVGLVSIGIAIALNQYFGPSLYPGVSVWVSTLLATAGMVFVAATFYFWSVTFPRSGGVYVSLSRTVQPGTAFVLSLAETVILMYYAALASSLIVTVGLSSFFATIGFIAGNATFISWAEATNSPAGIFWVGAGILVLAGALLSSGTRRYFTVQKILLAIAVVGTAVLAAVLLFGSREGFQENLLALTGLDYQSVISQALSTGWERTGFSLGSTVAFLVFPLLPLLGGIQSVAIGGEIKRVSRAQSVGMLGAVVSTGIVIALFAILANKTFGFDFQGAIAWNSLGGDIGASTEATVGAAPWFTVLAGILTNNVLLALIIMATFVTWIWFWIPAEIAYTTRTMIAWSFDRVAPDRLGYVSERFHTPVVAIWLSTVVSIVFMWLIAYQNIQLLTLIEAIMVIWGTAMVSAIFFPRTRRNFYEASPASQQKIGNLPAMSVTGFLAAAFFAFVLYLLWTDEIAAGPLFSADGVTTEFWLILGVVIFGIVWYVGTKAYRRREGIDIDLAFRQIPIE
jgi:amino acid transporter